MAGSRHPVDVAVGARVRELRIRAAMSQTKLGEALGVSFQQIQKYENGSNRMGASRLVQVATALNVPLAQLFTGVDMAEADRPEPALDGEASKVARDWAAIPNETMRESLRQVVRSMAEKTGTH
ncbi:MAG: helix-turn-helix transcriptional regulator [Marivibrio sp.]|uniref:helix-turn-helix domain-containing protein n=1 Tax=Marivibrio sp. TaxID=2039719 RepID=UPI0032ED6151